MDLDRTEQALALGQLEVPRQYAESIQRLGTTMRLKKNETLYKAGDIPENCYYLLLGQLVACEYTTAGEERVYSTNHPGELILVPSMVVTHPLTLNFKASEPSILVRISRETMFQAMRADPDFASMLVYSLSLRLITTIESSREQGNHSMSWRVCHLLLTMAERSSADYDDKLLIREKISQQAMASRLRVNRVTVARAIRDLKDLGLVENINGYYCIRSAQALQRHMEYLDAAEKE